MRMNLCWSQLCSRWVQNPRLGYNLLFDMLDKRLLRFVWKGVHGENSLWIPVHVLVLEV